MAEAVRDKDSGRMTHAEAVLANPRVLRALEEDKKRRRTKLSATVTRGEFRQKLEELDRS